MIAVSVKPCIVMCILPDAGAISTSAEFLCYIKVGFRRVYLKQTCFRDALFQYLPVRASIFSSPEPKAHKVSL